MAYNFRMGNQRMKHLIRILSITPVLILSFILSGCGDVSSRPTTAVKSDASITADCVVSYFRQGQAPYMTEQEHRFNPASGYLKIIANEPDSRYAFTLKKDKFSQSGKLTEFLSGLPAEFVSQPLATAVFYSFAAGAELLSTESLVAGEMIKLEGQWYEPMQAAWPKQDIQVILLKNTATNRIDSVGITQYKDGLSFEEVQTNVSDAIEQRWLARSYNLRYNSDLNTLAPRTIDIFDINDGIASKKRIIMFEYKTVQKTNQAAISE